MQSGFFWKNWTSPFRELYIGLLILFVASILGMFVFYLMGIEGTLGWAKIAQSESIQIAIESFKIGAFNLQTSVESQVFSQKFIGNLSEVNAYSYYGFLIVTVLCLNLLLTVVTTLPKFWYFVGTSLFIVVLVNLKLELLLLFGSSTKIGLIIALILYLPTTYVFNAIKTHITFISRLLIFLGLTIVFGVIIVFFSEVESPFFYIASYGLINPLIISIVFILMIAHEIITAFVYFLTRTSNVSGKSNLSHFFIITLIYLVNLSIAYLYETNIIQWDFLYINLFLLLGISATLGIWGYSLREEQYNYLFRFRPVGAIFFIAMGLCCFATIGHFMATGNDPAIEVFRDIIIYSHLGYGLLFVVYIVANFLDPLKRGAQVFKVLYKPTSMPYFTFRLAGLIAFAALTFKSNWQIPFNQSMSAYYNGLGDLHTHNNEKLLAKQFYTEGAIMGYNNHKSNYALATIGQQQQNSNFAAQRYFKATLKNPSPQSYVNLAALYASKDKFFDALFTLQEAHEKFPNNGQIFNNLGLLYTKTNILDTAAMYLDQASQIRDTKGTAGSNMLSLLALNEIPVHPDSVIANYEIEKDPISINNSIVLKNKLSTGNTERYEPKDSTLSYLQSSIYFNSAFNALFDKDSFNTAKLLAYSIVDNNYDYKNTLQLGAALNFEKNDNINKAFRQLNWIASNSSQKGGDYFDLIGLWALKHNAPDVAIQYFRWAQERNQPNATLHLAIALTESLQIDEAIEVWNSLLLVSNRSMQQIAANILPILTSEESELQNDNRRYFYLRYKTDYNSIDQFDRILNTIKNENYKAKAILDMAQKQWDQDREQLAANYFSKLNELTVTDKALEENLYWFHLKLLAATQQFDELQNVLVPDLLENKYVAKNYYYGLIAENAGDTTTAKNHFEYISYRNPFFEESVLAAAAFTNKSNSFKAYNILLNAIEVNPNSIKLLKAYILQCARLENTSYAEISLETLKTLMDTNAYQAFVNSYQQLLAEIQQEADEF